MKSYNHGQKLTSVFDEIADGRCCQCRPTCASRCAHRFKPPYVNTHNRARVAAEVKAALSSLVDEYEVDAQLKVRREQLKESLYSHRN